MRTIIRRLLRPVAALLICMAPMTSTVHGDTTSSAPSSLPLPATLIKDLDTTPVDFYNIQDAAVVGSYMVFANDYGVFSTDGSSITLLIKPLNERRFSLDTSDGEVIVANGEFALWRTDGTVAGTKPIYSTGFDPLCTGEVELVAQHDDYFLLCSTGDLWRYRSGYSESLGMVDTDSTAVRSGETVFILSVDTMYRLDSDTDYPIPISFAGAQASFTLFLQDHLQDGVLVLRQATTGETMRELWHVRQDGTTTRISTGDLSPSNVIASGEKLFIATLPKTDSAEDFGFFAIHGTAAPIKLANGYVNDMKRIGDRVAALVREDWDDASVVLTDGTEAGTLQTDIRATFIGPSFGDDILVGTTNYVSRTTDLQRLTPGGRTLPILNRTQFAAYPVFAEPRMADGSIMFNLGNELWRTDGTAAGTRRAVGGSTWSSQTFSSNPIVRHGDMFYMTAQPLSAHKPSGTRFFRTDGTGAGTVELASAPGNIQELWSNDAFILAGVEPPGKPLVMTSYLSATDTWTVLPIAYPNLQALIMERRALISSDDGIWATDGTPAGTSILGSVGNDAYLYSSVCRADACFLLIYRPGKQGYELWRTDGTEAGTIRTAALDEYLSNVTIAFLQGQVAIVADGYDGIRIWLGDAAGESLRQTVSLPDTATETMFATSSRLIIFTRTDTLFASDGTQSGTRMLLPDGQPGMQQQGCIWVNGRLMFRVMREDVHEQVQEWWITDGTIAGTYRTGLVQTQQFALNPTDSGQILELPNGLTLLPARDSGHGIELWVTDGTLSGTRLLSDILPGVSSSRPAQPTIIGDHVVFFADDGVHGIEPHAVRLPTPDDLPPVAPVLLPIISR